MKTTTLLMAALIICFTSGTVHYKTTCQQEQHPNRRWAKKQRHERRRDYVAQHENHRQHYWQKHSKRHHYHDRGHRDCRQYNTYQSRQALHHKQIKRIIVQIPRVVLNFPW
ncbi:MAG: hypothetical protein B6I37_02760 [Desulfobacteraceae bacterium 4572_35.2]|nr:MAG: hypothetical protein B6I37_02760 [Desulfobacteraceae bacterium 4572_35.2]